jgi:alpha-L-fucosidase
MLSIKKIIVGCALVLPSCALIAQPKTDSLYADWRRMHDSKADALVTFNEAKFGMFIHWGLYSILAGEWQGKRVSGLAEWIMYHAKIPKVAYSKLSSSFNPALFDAEEWVLVAKRAGMKYIVVTSKHHDGFSMYKTRHSPYNIISATPFGRDPIDELYHACKKHGLRFGVYYSQIIDWYDGWNGGMSAEQAATEKKKNPMNTWDRLNQTQEGYIAQKAIPQVKELIEKYPDMQEMWFDYWYEGKEDLFNTPEISHRFYQTLYQIAPKCLVSTRIGAQMGDFKATHDNEILSNSKINYWETPGTLNNTWGHSKFDTDWKSPEELLFWLVDIASKGGNYLLNIGPRADGSIPEQSIEVLSEIGTWMDINGPSVYGTRSWRINKEGPTQVLMKSTKDRELGGFKDKFTPKDIWFTSKGNKVYCIAFKRPSNQLTVRSLGKNNISKLTSVSLLGYSKRLKWKQTKETLEIDFPPDFNFRYGYCIEVVAQD